MTRDSMVKMLVNDVCYVRFTKVSTGEDRYMKATLHSAHIPADKLPADDNSPPNENTIRCFDVDKNDWRSFRVDSVKEFMSVATINQIMGF